MTHPQTTLISASQYLFSALDSRAFLRSATVLLPLSWPDSCVSTSVLSASGESSDITVQPTDHARGKIWTQQSLGCGQPGDQIYWGYESLLKKDNTLARSLIKEFAMYRYGVFEEQGYYSDPIYPMCYYDDQMKKAKVTGCSEIPIRDNGICSSDPNAIYNTTSMVDERARSSIMFAAEAPSVSMFCDEGNHDRLAPTKHNLICQRRSVLDVIISHKDFAVDLPQSLQNSNQITDTTPRIIYKKQNLTRYVFVIENTKDMMQRESWSYLRLALRQWALYILPDNTEIGMVLSDSVQSSRALNIVPAKANPYDRFGNSNRDKFYSVLPYIPRETMQPGCLHCSLKEAMHMLNARTKTHGPANNVIVVIAPGMNVDEHLNSTLKDLKRSKIKVASINYPDILRSNTLGLLAQETGGVDYTVFEQKLNVDSSLLSTYFELHNVLYDIVTKFYSGGQADLPMEIHRREITDDGRSSVTGSFIHQTYADRNDKFIDFKIITLNANISETGTWTYVVEPYPGNPQPHFLQVMATPKSPLVPVVRANFRMHRNSPREPLILLVDVKNGDLPILGAKVEVLVTKPDINGSMVHRSKIELLDTGAGDPDITKGDGVYTRYFSGVEWGPGLYTFEVVVTDNGNTAYTWTDSLKYNEDRPCCGSSITSDRVQPISPFQRILPKATILMTSEEIQAASQVSVGRIGDLKVQIIPEDMKARLSWTSPDMGGTTVSRYEIRYATSVLDIMDKFETTALIWDNDNIKPLPLAPGSETTFTLDMSQNKELLDKPLYFAIKAYPKANLDFSGTISNWVRVLVPLPPPPPTVPPTYSSNEQPFWPINHNNNVGVDPVSPSIASTMPVGLELILPVVIGLILLLILLIVYCYFCVLKKRTTDNHKSSSKANAIKKDNLSSTITIVPSSPQNATQTYVSAEVPDPHQVGVPVNNYAYEDETKKRYSLVHQQEQQLIEELKQQQQIHQQRDIYGGVSVISNTLNRNQAILSPYNSWSASQLLHEHERRHSPMDGSMMEQEQMMPHQDVMMNGDHMSVNGQSMDHMSVNGHQVQENYPQGHLPPPVPPLPAFNGNGYPVNYNIYGVHQAPAQQGHAIYQSMPRNESLAPFNPSLQGSLNSVNSGEKKRRNVTMV
ncbi:hypothetical protein NQ315_004501 [Exocentrus adspersus]|uniref:Calcium-activated chloride channel N-terminal domain-containing protein n=1 Tax=Exocentrus adspersus TaxID=1586481 RepID=A0AAV8VPN5_9CUCU|nr:hypothetical protein NQ315_004501 [Exocentrus adspersus]